MATIEYKWIPWQRYILLLEIDNKRTINLGRFKRVENLSRTAKRLAALKGYLPTIIDTKKNEVVPYN